MAFFGGDETVTPPWMDPSAASPADKPKAFTVLGDLQTGTLADYLGVPTTITGSYGQEEEFNPIFCSLGGYSGNICSAVLTSDTSKSGVYEFFASKVGSPIYDAISCTYPSGDIEEQQTFGFCIGYLPSSSAGKSGTVIVRSIRGLLMGTIS